MLVIRFTNKSNIDEQERIVDYSLITVAETTEEELNTVLGNDNILLSKFEKTEWDNILKKSKEFREKPFKEAIQNMMEEDAKENGYSSLISACTYATSGGTFASEGQSFVVWRDSVWTKAYKILLDVNNGIIPEPTIDELLTMLPSRVVL